MGRPPSGEPPSRSLRLYSYYANSVTAIVLVLGILAVSTSAPLVHWAAPAPPLLVAATRVSLAAAVLCAFAGRDLVRILRLSRREKTFVLLSGLLLGAHFGVWIASLYYTSTAASVALVATQPVFAGLLAWVFLGERIARREVIGIAIAALGCGLLAGGDLLVAPGAALFGDALAIGGAITAAGYFTIGRRLRSAVPLAAYMAAVNAIAAVVLVAAAAIADTPVRGFASSVYAAMALCALVPSLIGHTLLNWTVRRVRVHLVALAILGEPLGASLLTWIFFAEAPPSHAALGGLVILLGIGVGFTRFERKSPT
jgi:drug/metabolite transporter (DMT)-like permease